MTNTPTIILSKPQMAENIGACARAMVNCGLTKLRLIAPKQEFPHERATVMSVGAFDHMPPVEIFDTLEDAIHDITTLYATTARKRDMVKPVMHAGSATPDMFERTQNGEHVGLLFGGERAGLDNRDISFADILVRIPLNPDFSSLNLAQAVLLVSYEWSKHVFSAPDTDIHFRESIPATGSKMTDLYTRLENELDDHNFFRTPEMQPKMMNSIRSMLARTNMSEQEAQTFHGIISALSDKRNKH
jgi:tRNA/rRNA methyltransferase